MKHLTIPSDNEVALEGFIGDIIDYLTGSLYGTLDPKTATRITNEVFDVPNKKDIVKRIEPILKQTLGNSQWLKKSAKPRTYKPKSEYLFISGKAISDPVKAAQLITGDMFSTLKSLNDIFKENVKVRRELITTINKLGKGDGEKADKFYIENKSRLTNASADHYVASKGKICKSVDESETTGTWPVYKTAKGYMFVAGLGNRTSPAMDYVTAETANDWYKAIMSLIECAVASHQLYAENSISYWDSCEVEYDTMKYGDEIFDNIYSNQDPYAAIPMTELAGISLSLARSMLMAVVSR